MIFPAIKVKVCCRVCGRTRRSGAESLGRTIWKDGFPTLKPTTIPDLVSEGMMTHGNENDIIRLTFNVSILHLQKKEYVVFYALWPDFLTNRRGIKVYVLQKLLTKNAVVPAEKRRFVAKRRKKWRFYAYFCG